MENTTKALLRNAILEAVTAEQDAAALELLNILNGQPMALAAAKPAQLALPPVRQITDGPAHDYHYWVAFIRESFIPFMSANGRLRFTSHELLTWLENNPALTLTAGDIEHHATGREVWRNGVSAALSALKQRGILNAPAFGKDYEILRPALIGAN
jgi:hypothetical protein